MHLQGRGQLHHRAEYGGIADFPLDGVHRGDTYERRVAFDACLRPRELNLDLWQHRAEPKIFRLTGENARTHIHDDRLRLARSYWVALQCSTNIHLTAPPEINVTLLCIHAQAVKKYLMHEIVVIVLAEGPQTPD